MNKELKNEIKSMLALDRESIEFDMLPIGEIDNFLKEEGFIGKHIETNGWQVDFWKDYIHPKYGTYNLSGGLYESKWSLSKKEEDYE